MGHQRIQGRVVEQQRGACGPLAEPLEQAIAELDGHQRIEAQLEKAGAPRQAPRVGVAEDLRRLGGDAILSGTRFRVRQGSAR